MKIVEYLAPPGQILFTFSSTVIQIKVVPIVWQPQDRCPANVSLSTFYEEQHAESHSSIREEIAIKHLR